MPVYEYTALDAKGRTKSGIIDAEGTSAARQKLRSSGFYPVSIQETQEEAERKEPRGLNLSRYFSRVKPSEIAGVIDTWDGLRILKAEGITFSFKRFCAKVKNEKQASCDKSYFECNPVCKGALASFLSFLKDVLPEYVNVHGMKEAYPLMDLLSFLDGK